MHRPYVWHLALDGYPERNNAPPNLLHAPRPPAPPPTPAPPPARSCNPASARRRLRLRHEQGTSSSYLIFGCALFGIGLWRKLLAVEFDQGNAGGHVA